MFRKRAVKFVKAVQPKVPSYQIHDLGLETEARYTRRTVYLVVVGHRGYRVTWGTKAGGLESREFPTHAEAVAFVRGEIERLTGEGRKGAKT